MKLCYFIAAIQNDPSTSEKDMGKAQKSFTKFKCEMEEHVCPYHEVLEWEGYEGQELL